jgi:DNA transformation protein
LAADDSGHIQEMFASFGPVSVRRMFGGAGIYCEGVMFALSYNGLVYLKADETTAPSFEREGSAPFMFTSKDGKRTTMSYWRLPDRLYDDPDELAIWAKAAIATARQAPKIRRPAPRRRRLLPGRSRK